MNGRKMNEVQGKSGRILIDQLTKTRNYLYDQVISIEKLERQEESQRIKPRCRFVEQLGEFLDTHHRNYLAQDGKFCE